MYKNENKEDTVRFGKRIRQPAGETKITSFPQR